MSAALIAEQTTRYRFVGLEIALGLRLEIPGEPGVHVVIDLPGDAGFPGDVKDTLDRHCRDGVHGGLAMVDAPLPPGGIRVIVSEYSVSPAPDSLSSGPDLMSLGSLLELLMRQAVATLWEGLRHLEHAEGASVTP